MAFLEALRGEMTREVLESSLVWLLIAGRFHTTLFRRSGEQTSFWASLKVHAAIHWGVILLYLFCNAWMAKVNAVVAEPYLDEVFHIPQALQYCKGRYYEWDDKITTPPGLYALSVLYHRVWGYLCTTPSLRRINLYGILLVAHFASVTRQSLEARSAGGRPPSQTPSFYATHVATNIALFPALFFFSALYYTDIVSALVVLVSYQNHLKRLSRDGESGLASSLWTVLLGVAALFMRQTNVFWVVVYMGGLEAVHAVRSLKPTSVETPQFTTLASLVRFYSWRYSIGDIHDPPLSLARNIDWVFCVLSIAIAAVCNTAKVLRQIWPHITIMGLFVAFVVWNGGVVLGDKSNHIATLHLAQMLYIWPLFAFFSTPLLIPTAASLVSSVLQTTSRVVRWQKPGERSRPTAAQDDARKPPPVRTERKSSVSNLQKSLALITTEFLCQNAFPPIFLLGGIILSLAIVKYNTIIHPFTLADNRHYMFYVFRYTILRSTKVRLSLVAVYAGSAWLVWNRLGGCPATPSRETNHASPTEQGTTIPFISTPFPPATMRESQEHPRAGGPRLSSPNNRAAVPADEVVTLDDPTSTSTTSPPTSTALLLFLTSALSLVTAPLVEPRYFILPWIFWRVLVPAWPARGSRGPESLGARLSHVVPGAAWLHRQGRRFDLTVVLETLWFLLVNAGTMYMFLYKPFVWKGSDGSVLDGGRTQRFMW